MQRNRLPPRKRSSRICWALRKPPGTPDSRRRKGGNRNKLCRLNSQREVYTAQPMGGPMVSARGKPNPMVQRKKMGPYRVQESASSRSGPSWSNLQVRAPVVQNANGYWDWLGAFHDPWGGVYFQGLLLPVGRANALQSCSPKGRSIQDPAGTPCQF